MNTHTHAHIYMYTYRYIYNTYNKEYVKYVIPKLSEISINVNSFYYLLW